MGALRNRIGEVTVSVGIGVGIVIGCVAIGVSAVSYRVARNVPMIHDITTDPGDPPSFSALLPERKASWNGAEYGGPAVAEKQRRAYPDIVPIESALPPGEAFERALAVARGMGWKVAGADAAGGRIEATDATPTFRFKDDIVVRVRPGEEGGSRVDIRSVSRLGLSDLGKNADRIREFEKRFDPRPAPAEESVIRASTGSRGPSPPGGSPPNRLARSPGNS